MSVPIRAWRRDHCQAGASNLETGAAPAPSGNQAGESKSMLQRTFPAMLAAMLFALSAAAAIRPEVAGLLPPDAVTIGGFDVQALRGTPFFGPIADRFPLHGDERLEQLFAIADFDPHKDIYRILAAGDGGPGRAVTASLVIAEGRFDFVGKDVSTLALFTPAGEHGGFTLYSAARDGDRRPSESTFAFLDSQTFVLGPDEQVRAAIDRWLQPGEPSRSVRTALAQRDAHVWAATLEPDALLGPWIDNVPGGGGPLRAIAGAMQSLAIRATALAGAVQAEMAFLCGGAEDARSLADAAQTLAAFGAMSAQRDRPEVADLLSKLQINQNDSETTLSLELTNEQLLNLRR
jgi:hypothetical protein